jgi:hypothetical protein
MAATAHTRAEIAVQADAGASNRLFKVGIGLGVVGLAGVGGAFAVDSKQAFFSYLTAFAFYVTIALGGLFFTMLHHLVRATWSTPLRRAAENLAANLPLMAVLFIPVVIGMHDLYHWSHAEAVEGDPILKGKAGYLAPTFWIVRAVVYFAVWILLATFFRKNSIRQDETGDVALTFKMRKLAPVGVLAFALTITFAGFDWLMSLNPHWFSTIFGVYIFAGATMSMFAALALTALWLSGRAGLQNSLTIDNVHDVGKLMFGFIVFWTYIAFSQYYLIWYGNIPEETIWYKVRLENGWQWYSRLLAVGHFALPFWVLMSRHAKRNRLVLGVTAVWLLAMHFLDHYLLVSPTLHDHGPHPATLWMDAAAMLGIGGLFVALYARRFTKAAAMPARDPQLAAALEYDNA